MAEEAGDRRSRLKALREAAQAAGAAPAAPAQPAAAPEEPVVRLRNYKLRDETVAHSQVEAAKAPVVKLPEAAPVALTSQQDIIEAYAPKKAHLDLKRDCAKRVAKLDRKTQRALRELAEELAAAAPQQ